MFWPATVDMLSVKWAIFTQRIKDFGNTYASYDHQGEKTMVFSSKYWYLGVPDATFPKRPILGRRDLGCRNPSDDQDETVDDWVSWLVNSFFRMGGKILLEYVGTS